jgi:TonB-linked SusC/RagA family outer membrane protein
MNNIIKRKILLFIMLLTSVTLWSKQLQDYSVNLNFNNQEISNVFNSITEQTGIGFSYLDEVLKSTEKVSINVSNSPLDKVLAKLLFNKGLVWSLKNKTVLIKQREAINISGTVLDENGEPLPGVNVVVKGTTKGSITDIDGNFVLNQVVGQQLIFTSIGYKTVELEIGNRSKFDVKLEEDAVGLDEVVVVGYGTQKKINLSGAVESVGAKTLENRPITNVTTGLQGAISNLNISVTSGRATEAPEFNVRGFTSINGGNPLILVDNVPYTAGEVSRLNPGDIASVTVLKDAASAAIYGARAAFGVVIITTKTATSDKLEFSYNTNLSYKKITRNIDIVTDPLTVMKYKDVMGAPWYDLYKDADFKYVERMQKDPKLPSTIVNPENPNAWTSYGSTDWFNEIFEEYSPSYNHNLSIAKRGDKLSYYMSAEYSKQEGMLKYGNDVYDRYNFRTKLDYEIIKDILILKTNSVYNYSKYNAPYNSASSLFHNVNRTPSLSVPKNPDGSWTEDGVYLIKQQQDGGRDIDKTSDILYNFSAEVNIIKDIWKVTGEANFRNIDRRNHNYWFPMEYRTGPKQKFKIQNGTSHSKNTSVLSKYNVYNLYTNFDYKISKNQFSVVVGYNQEYKEYNSFNTSRKNLISNSLPSIQLSTGDKNNGESGYDWAVQGLFYRFNYIFDNKYIIETNGRYDGTSRFPDGDRWGFFPSASIAWVASEEWFLKKLNPYLSFTKFRLSYGSLGNQDVSHYAYVPEMDSDEISSVLEGQKPVAVYPPGLVSNSLTWETVETKNVGVDLGFFKGRLSTSFDYYQRDTKDMLTKGKTLPSVLGASVPKTNAADLKVKGWELTASWNDQFNLINSDFRYGLKFIISDSEAEITKFDNPTKRLGDYYEGRKIGEIWGLETEGFFKDADDVKNHADQSSVSSYPGTRPIEAGDLKFKDLNGDKVVNDGDWTKDNPGDYKIIGNNRARYLYSLDITADYKGFDFRAFFQGVGKRDYYFGAGHHYFWGVYAQPWANVLKRNLDHWTPENPNGYFPRLKSYTAEQNWKALGNPQTKYLQDASYVRFKNLTIGYTLPIELTQKFQINKFRLYFSGENLFELTDLPDDIDPELLGTHKYPIQRVFSFGLNLQF